MVEKVSDFKMPEKVVTRLLRDALPDNVLITAAEKAEENRRKNLDSKDIISAVTDLGLGEYAPQLARFCAQRKRNAKRRETSLLKTKSPKKIVNAEAEPQYTPDPIDQIDSQELPSLGDEEDDDDNDNNLQVFED